MLTDAKLKRLTPGSKTVKHFDGGGLFLEVPKSGNKRWRLKYRFGGKEKLLAIGVYPTITLKEARNKREAAKKLLAAGTDPATVKREEKRAVRMAMA
ncbi:MAG: DUF4102 domain-containing protein, partial [Magnetococcales bacterium]|nr:DUF4102 domain-containing protein [Magnetococcales bacterium]